MHDIEPWHGWRDEYQAERDPKSPFYRRTYSEFTFSNRIYNYVIHPQWDEFGSETLYCKILYCDYSKHFCVIELIGEWNDAIGNDIMFLKRDIVDPLMKNGISKFILIVENVLNYHGDDDSYFEEWYSDVRDEKGWVALVQMQDHVAQEFKKYRLDYYVHWKGQLQLMSWRDKKPEYLVQEVAHIIKKEIKYIENGRS